jgi:hypothetical protein
VDQGCQLTRVKLLPRCFKGAHFVRHQKNVVASILAGLLQQLVIETVCVDRQPVLRLRPGCLEEGSLRGRLASTGRTGKNNRLLVAANVGA